MSYEDETWWSRFAQPRLRVWAAADKPLRLVEQVKQKEDPDPKALACYGLLVRWATEEQLAREHTTGSILTSAKSGVHVEEAFLDLSRRIEGIA